MRNNRFFVRLDSCDSMQAYLDKLTTFSNKLGRIGITVPDQLLAAFMLAGLSEEYKPFILGFQGNIGELSTQTIKMRLLDCQLGLFNQPSSSAFIAKKNKKKNRNGMDFKCFKFGKRGHKKVDCTEKSDDSEDEKEEDGPG